MAAPAEKMNDSVRKDQGKPDIAALMAEIRAKVRKEIEAGGREKRDFSHAEARFSQEGQRRAGELLHSEDLRYLNLNYSSGANLNLDSIASHRPGLIGRAIVALKRKLLRIIWDSLLRDYLAREKDFNANLVRFLNDVSKYVDARDAANFWELIRKIDTDVTRAQERIERIADELSATAHATEKRVVETLNQTLADLRGALSAVQASSAEHRRELTTLDGTVRGLEGIIALLGSNGSGDSAARSQVPSPSKSTDYGYLLLENRYRGSEDEIRRRMEIYPELFKGAAGKVLEIGPGRGELLNLFKEHGISAYGVDSDAAMVQTAAARGVEVRLEDGLAHLRGVADASLGGLIACQVAEHLPIAVLRELLRESRRAVKPGGKVILETINPRSLIALSSNYFRDPTHVWPLHPDTLAYEATLAGFGAAEVRMLSPIPEEAQLQPVPIQPYMTPHWAHAVAVINHNISQLNGLLFGYQDYCIIATVPVGKD